MRSEACEWCTPAAGKRAEEPASGSDAAVQIARPVLSGSMHRAHSFKGGSQPSLVLRSFGRVSGIRPLALSQQAAVLAVRRSCPYFEEARVQAEAARRLELPVRRRRCESVQPLFDRRSDSSQPISRTPRRRPPARNAGGIAPRAAAFKCGSCRRHASYSMLFDIISP